MNLLLSIAFLSLASSNMDQNVIVRVKQGDLKGLVVKTDSGGFYYSFRGIPYAKPPLGPLRFKPPEPADSWDGVRDAIDASPRAPQMNFFTGVYEGTEDCLYINVFTPQIPSGENSILKPVLVYVHGGGYFGGFGDMHGPARMMNTGEVVLVTMNYRLGALGFLSTGDSVVSGNNGLKDQVLSFRWVKENIAKFGGDPDNVTIGGISAGGSSTHLHLCSPMSKGLFHKCIAESGSALAPWSAQDPDVARAKAFRLGEDLGLNTNDSKELVHFLRSVPAKTIIEHSLSFLTEDQKHPLPWTFLPVIERGVDPNSMFLPEKPLKLIREKNFNQVPFLTGVTDREGLIIVYDLFKSQSWYEGLNDDLGPVFVNHLDFRKGTRHSKELTAKIRDYFFGDKPISKDTWGELVDIYGDVLFNIWADKAAKEQAMVSDSPLYFYQFSYNGAVNFGLPELNISGAAHGANLGYLFEADLGPIVIKELHGDDKKMSDRIIKLWINFAKTGNPTPESDPLLGVTWTPFTKTEYNYLNMDKELTMHKDIFKDRMQFWDDLLPSHED